VARRFSPSCWLRHEDARLDDIQRVRKDRGGGAKAIVKNLNSSLERFVDLCDGID